MPIGRRAVLLATASAALAPAAGAAPLRYDFDQSVGAIDFTAHHLGLLTSTGQFRRFMAEIVLDSADARRAAIEATIQTGSVALSWPGAEDTLRSAAYFDSAQFPTAHFKGATVGPGDLTQFAIRGMLSLRGVTRPFDMQGRLLSRQFDPKRGADVATFTARGTLSRSDYGMTEDTLMTGDRIGIEVHVAIQLAAATHAG